MLGELSATEIEDLLRKQFVGRIGCHDKDLVYVVPISYAYDKDCVYCHAYEGKKIDIMRKNPKVCFQVDEMRDMANWRSVMAWGEFHELSNEDEKAHALLVLLHRQLPSPSSITTHLGKFWPFAAPNTAELVKIPGITFLISLTEKTGRFESTTESHMLA
jgi:nitroimidazol reductase NimA-like FMN-containing flavoprotein (pyridoxamine 5'-phosphate oxidase superfamily)